MGRFRVLVVLVVVLGLLGSGVVGAGDGGVVLQQGGTGDGGGVPLGSGLFDDVPVGHWADEEVGWAVSNGVMEGVGGGRFDLGGAVPRWQIVSVLFRAFVLAGGVVDEGGGLGSDEFVDVPVGHWADEEIGWAVSSGITRGVSGGRFDPDGVVTRAQIVTFLFRLSGLLGGPVDGGLGSDEFVDVPVGHWADEEVGWAVAGGVTVGVGRGRFDLDLVVSRAQIVTFLFRVVRLVEGSTVDVTVEEVDLAHVDSGEVRVGLGVEEPVAGYTAVSVGGYHVCALRTDQAISCWGNNTYGAASPPKGKFIAVSAGARNSCGIQADRTITCWGFVTESTPEGEFTNLAVTLGLACAIGTDQTMSCWGGNWAGQADPPDGKYTDLALTYLKGCGLRTDQTVACWGEDRAGETSPPEGTFTAIAMSAKRSCGLSTDQTVVCWGEAWADGGSPPEGGFISIAIGRYSLKGCGLRTDQTVACWGEDRAGETSPPEGTFTAIAVGGQQSCALGNDQTITCWGVNWAGQDDPPQGEYVAITTGGDHSCGLGTDKTVTCWGQIGRSWQEDREGEVGDDGTIQWLAPQGTYTAKGEFLAIASGWSHSCGLLSDQTITCWGRHYQDPLPEGRFTAIALGMDHSCAIDTNNAVVCWDDGHSRFGQTDPPDGNFVAISAGETNSCGITTEETVICWGSVSYWGNGYGQSQTSENTFTAEGQYTAVASGGSNACAIGTDQTVTCWETSSGGRLRPPEGRFTAIAAGGSHACAIGADRTVTCWGSNEVGQASPPQGHFTAIAANREQSCGIQTDQTITCWGQPPGRPLPTGVQWQPIRLR